MFYFRYLLSNFGVFLGIFSLILQQPVNAATGVEVSNDSIASGSKLLASVPKKAVNTTNSGINSNYLQSCPLPVELVKKGMYWVVEDKVTKDEKWKSFTSSSATKVLSFNGAQWRGIKVGSITCLYITDEAVSYPLALEQKISRSILEPISNEWSALVNNIRMCKSSSVADCKYFVQPPKDISNIYKEIEYAPSKDN